MGIGGYIPPRIVAIPTRLARICNQLLFPFVYREETHQQDEGQYEGPAGMDPEGVIESTWNEVVHNFDDMNLKEELLRGIYAYGYERPSAIQQRAILPCIKERDVIAQAQSGKFCVHECSL